MKEQLDVLRCCLFIQVTTRSAKTRLCSEECTNSTFSYALACIGRFKTVKPFRRVKHSADISSICGPRFSAKVSYARQVDDIHSQITVVESGPLYKLRTLLLMTILDRCLHHQVSSPPQYISYSGEDTIELVYHTSDDEMSITACNLGAGFVTVPLRQFKNRNSFDVELHTGDRIYIGVILKEALEGPQASEQRYDRNLLHAFANHHELLVALDLLLAHTLARSAQYNRRFVEDMTSN